LWLRLISILHASLYNPFKLNGIENNEESKQDEYRSGKTTLKWSCLIHIASFSSKLAPDTNIGRVTCIYRNIEGGTSDNCRACVLVLAAMQNVLVHIHEKCCRLLCTNIEFIRYPIYISVGITLTDVRCVLKYLRTICE